MLKSHQTGLSLSLPILAQIEDKNVSLVITGGKGFTGCVKRRSKEPDISPL